MSEKNHYKHTFLLEVWVLRLYLIFLLHVVGYVLTHKHPGSPCVSLLSTNFQPPGFAFAGLQKNEEGMRCSLS